jgi:hemoglobin
MSRFALGVASVLALLPALAAEPAGTSLYDRLGGGEGLRIMVGELVDRSASDPATGRSFAKTDLERIKRLLAEQLCQLSGGPCRYSGDDMRQVHGGLGITETEFYGMVGHLRAILDRHGIAQADKNALLAKLAPMAREVIDPPK